MADKKINYYYNIILFQNISSGVLSKFIKVNTSRIKITTLQLSS